MNSGAVEARSTQVRSPESRSGLERSDEGQTEPAQPVSKGQLLATPAVSIERVAPSPQLESLVRHYWIPRWNLPDGRDLHQHVLEYPSMNLVIEPGDARLYRAMSGRSTQVLNGSGWAFGALLQPGVGATLLGASARSMPGDGVPVRMLAVPGAEAAADAVRTANERASPTAADGASAPGGSSGGSDVTPADGAMIAAFERWLRGLRLTLDPDAELMRSVVAEVESDRSLLRVDDLAARFGIGVRHLQRLVNAYIGFGPKWLIQRYRLQEAARALEDVTPPRIADLAAALGYADQAHFSREFKTVVGMPPGEYLATAAERTVGGADVHEADVYGADVHGADVHGADVHGARA